MAKDAYWFPHDSNAKRDLKMIRLRTKMGYEGIGIFWSLIEMLREIPGYRLPVSDVDMAAVDLGLDADKTQEAIDLFCEIGLLTHERGHYQSKSLTSRMETWEKQKANGKKGGRPRKQRREKPNQNPNRNPNDNPTPNPDAKPNETITVQDRRVQDRREQQEHETGVVDVSFLGSDYRHTYGAQVSSLAAEFQGFPEMLVRQCLGPTPAPEAWVVNRREEYGWPQVAAALVITRDQATKPNLRYADQLLKSGFRNKGSTVRPDFEFLKDKPTDPELDAMIEEAKAEELARTNELS